MADHETREAIAVALGIHDWFEWERPSGKKMTCCRHCGIIRRADGKNKPCRGDIAVELRETLEDVAPALPVLGTVLDAADLAGGDKAREMAGWVKEALR